MDLDELYFAALAGVVYGVMFYSFHPYARPRVLPISLGGIWLTFIFLQNVERFVEGDPLFWSRLAESSFKWLIYVALATAAVALLRRWDRDRREPIDSISMKRSR